MNAPELLVTAQCLRMLITAVSPDVRAEIYERELILQQKCEAIISQLRLLNMLTSDKTEYIRVQNVVLLAIDRALRQLRKPNVLSSIGSLENATAAITSATERINGITLRLTNNQLAAGNTVSGLMADVNTNITDTPASYIPDIFKQKDPIELNAGESSETVDLERSRGRSGSFSTPRRVWSTIPVFSELLNPAQEEEFLGEEDSRVPGSALYAEVHRDEFHDICAQVTATELMQLFLHCWNAIEQGDVECAIKVGDAYYQDKNYEGAVICYNFGRNNGSLEAILKLGRLYRNAEDASIRDPRKALNLYMDAASMYSEEGAEEYIKLCWAFNSTEEEKERARTLWMSKTFEKSCIVQYLKGKMILEENMMTFHKTNAFEAFNTAISLCGEFKKSAMAGDQQEKVGKYEFVKRLALEEINNLERMPVCDQKPKGCGLFRIVVHNRSQQQIKLFHRVTFVSEGHRITSQNWKAKGYKYCNKNSARELLIPHCVRIAFELCCSCQHKCIFVTDYNKVRANTANFGCLKRNKCIEFKLSNY